MLIHENRGFSILELMIVVVIAAILANIAIPSLTSFIDIQGRKGALNDLIGVFAFARQHSVMSGAIVTVCPLDAALTCGRNWNGDIHAFLDPDNARQLSTSENLLRTISPRGNGRIVTRSLNRSFFQFKPNGFIHSDLGNITWCPKSGDTKKAGQIIISRGGRVRIARDTDNDGTPEDANGRPVRC